MNSLELYQLWGNLYGHKELAACTSSFLVGKSQTLARSLESLYVKGILLPIKKKSPHSYGNSLDSAYSPPWPGSIPSQGTKIPQAMWYDQKKKKIIISTIP